jgi:YHS domain-containing protein
MKARLKGTGPTILVLLGLAVTLATGAVRAWAAPPNVSIPERTRVCMMQDTVMAVPAVPLTHNGKSYFGCCEMCKAKIAAEPERYTLARDPVSGAVVDKATAALLSVDGRVLYFESEETRARYTGRLTGSP